MYRSLWLTADDVPLDHQRGVITVGPLAHGAVVIARSCIPQELQNEESVRRTDACLSIRDDFFVGRGTDRLQHGS